MSLSLPEQPSRNRSPSVGDSGLPKHEHKRPRLSESQGVDYQDIRPSSDDLNDFSATQTTTQVGPNLEQGTSALASPPQSPLPRDNTADTTSPRSKVTINTRPIASHLSAVNTAPPTANGSMQPGDSKLSSTVWSQSSPQRDISGQSDAISISSDEECGSPVIQIAVPEDIDQDPAHTRWEPISDPSASSSSAIQPNHVRTTFPYVSSSTRLQTHVVVGQISKIFLDGAPNEHEVFQDVKTWIVHFARHAQNLTYDFFDQEREFWLKVPNMVGNLFKRKLGSIRGLQLDDLVDFLVAYARITVIIVKIDAAKLRVFSDAIDARSNVVPLYPNFLIQLQVMLSLADTPLYEDLQEASSTSSGTVTDKIIDQLRGEYAVHYVQAVNTLFIAMAALFQKRSAYIEPGINLIYYGRNFVNLILHQAFTHPMDISNPDAPLESVLHAAWEFLESINAVLDRAVSKQQPWLNIETCEQVFKTVTPYVAFFAANSPEAAVELMLAANVPPTNFSDEDRRSLASTAWKFTTLQKFIKRGRMEVRVTCIQIMAHDLVDVFHAHIRTFRDLKHASVRFMNHFIRENDIIRYIIGVDSHPQIIERSSNIIGFLCVSHTYRNDDTDVIWQTIIESQDPRAIAALLVIFQTNLDNLDLDVLCHIARKLQSLPYERYDVHMLEFTIRLVAVVNHKITGGVVSVQEENEVNECTLQICFKLLREASTSEQLCIDHSMRIRTQIQAALASKIKMMKSLLDQTGDVDFLHSMLVKLCNSVRVHDEFTTGSTIAISTILAEADAKECLRVVQSYDLASLLIDDIKSACSTLGPAALQETTQMEFEQRFALMITLVYHADREITGPLLDTLWTTVLSSAELDQQLRSMAWAALANIFDSCQVRNVALDNIVEEYLPNLSPALYDPAVLHFAQQSVKYEMRHNPIELMESKAVVVVPGIGRIWDIMLTAPANTVEILASKFIIEQYLDGECIMKQDPASAEATHLSLIDQSVQQVIDAAEHLQASSDSRMSGSPSTPFPNQRSPKSYSNAMRFHRSLLFLRNFLDSLKSRSRYTPAVNNNLKKVLDTFDAKGQALEVTLQIIGHKTLASIQMKWVLGYANTCAEVWQFLSEITGWTHFTIISGGKRFALKDEQSNLQELGIKPGSFMINKIQGSPESTPARAVRASSPVDKKVMDHFDDLYNLLELEPQFAKEVFDFLRMFSSHTGIVQSLKSKTIPPDQLLPIGKPFKLMYCTRALRSCMEDESFSPDPSKDFLVYGIRTILSTLPSLKALQAERGTRTIIAQGLMEALILGFRARVPASVSSSYVDDRTVFSGDILALWSQVLSMDDFDSDLPPYAALIRAPFETLVEALLHDDRVWTSLVREDFRDCLTRSLLCHPLREVRLAILEVIQGLTGAASSKPTIKSNDSRSPRTRFPPATIENCLAHLWDILFLMIEETDSSSATCEEYFDVVTSVLKQHQQRLNDEELKSSIEIWKSLLLAHQHKHVIGLAPQDFFIASIGKLLLQAITIARLRAPLPESNSFVRSLFSLFLFPPLTDTPSSTVEAGVERQQQSDPILDMNSRWILYEIVLLLSLDRNVLDTLCEQLDSGLCPKYFHLDPFMNNDRQSLRSETGYSGLRNLSNTCYLNSLVSQLFMNLEFRELVMNVNIIDRSKQKLVAELGKVFAYMQSCYEEAVNPEPAIDAITLWDGDQIDVTVQMDVDEFFNLLFDRLESQIVDPKVRKAFKNIYGGQLVQQIKSKECEHVSERDEPFTAVQVEIKGKTTLEESLRAYVEGEVLQGENKYSCTGCAKHVDAVKRACLKNIPDHLIFNLKRFDYDIMTGTRCKVNDEFGFPETIDMAPFTLEALSHPEKHTDQDMFELVGIIIHSGTAESGHYYSYIRQRPSKAPKEKAWVHFNDHDVSQFDPASIRECCFGGIDFGAVQCPKFYNGYMLFYQRSSSIRAFERQYVDDGPTNAVSLSVTSDLADQISQHNSHFLRSYVAQNPGHAKFMRILLQQNMTSEQTGCPENHDATTSKLLYVALDYMNQFSARWKDLPEVEESLNLLRGYAAKCTDCANQIVMWLTKGDNVVDNLIRSCYAPVRRGFMALIATCWTTMAAEFGQTQQVLGTADEVDSSQRYLVTLGRFMAVLAQGWEHIQRHGRSWEYYFGLVTFILNLGKHEALAVMEAGFLELTLELIYVHVPNTSIQKRMRSKYSSYLLQRERNRPFAHNHLIQLFADLLEHVELVAPSTDHEDRVVADGRVSLSAPEAFWLGLNSPGRHLIWLEKIIVGRSNPPAVDQIIANVCRSRQHNALLCGFLKEGLADQNLMLAIAYLRPTLVFIASCSSRDIVVEAVDEALDLIETINGQYGKDFLNFVQELLQISNAEASITEGALRPVVKRHVPNWAPALLMAPNDIHADVRSDTVNLVNELLLRDLDGLKQTDHRTYRQDVAICKSLAKTCSTFAETVFIKARAPTIQPGQANQVTYVVDQCLKFFGETAVDEELAAHITTVMEEFRARSEGVVETATDGDWNASSDLEAMSEVDGLSDTSN